MTSIGFVLGLGAAACGSSSSSNGTGGTTGATGGVSGGMTGTGGTSGSGGTTGAVDCGDLPTCVATLVASCPLASNACLISSAATPAGDGITQNICFGNPATVKVVNTVTNDPNTGAGTTSISVTKNGVVCYTLHGTFNAQDPLTTPRVLSFKDPSGAELATFATDISIFPHTTMVTCAGGAPVAITDFGNCGKPNDPEPDQCVGGACVAP